MAVTLRGGKLSYSPHTGHGGAGRTYQSIKTRRLDPHCLHALGECLLMALTGHPPRIRMSAFGGKADMTRRSLCPLLTQSGHQWVTRRHQKGFLSVSFYALSFGILKQVMNTAPAVRLYGKRGSPRAYAIRDFLQRSDIPFEWVELSTSEQACAELGLENLDDWRLPICIFPDGTRMEHPSVRQVTEKLGWFRNPSRSEYDLAIYGAGPAGLSASVYGASEGLKTVLVERLTVEGQEGTSPRNRELSRFSERDQRGGPRRAGARTGREIRCRDPHPSGRCSR